MTVEQLVMLIGAATGIIVAVFEYLSDAKSRTLESRVSILEHRVDKLER